MHALLSKEDLTQYIKIVNFDNSASIKDISINQTNESSIKTEALIKLNLFNESLLQVRHIFKSYEI